MLLIGTGSGTFRVSAENIEDAKKVLDSEDVLRIRKFGDEVFAATRSGLFRSKDEGKTWTNLEAPQKEVYSVLRSPDGQHLYAGTHPAHLYISENGGESWREAESLQDQPSRDSWRLPRHRNEAHVRSLIAHSDRPKRVAAGIEVGGVHVSDDRGESWTERRDGVHDDIHHLLVVGADEYIASTGGGLYRTRDAGRSWTRLDGDLDHTYFREAFIANGRLYTAAARSSPGTWGGAKGTDAALFESIDDGDTFESVSYPGKPQEFILAWAGLADGEVIAGTNRGRILQRINERWQTLGQLPQTIRSLCAV